MIFFGKNIDNGRTCSTVVHGDCYLTIILYLHRTPAYPSPWNSALHNDHRVRSMKTYTLIKHGNP